MWKRFLKNLRLSESYISMGLGLLVVIVIGVLLFNFFSGRGKTEAPTGGAKSEEKQAGQVILPTTHTVVEGETLWSIAEKYFNSGYNWVDIAKENQLINPDSIEAGRTLTIPKAERILLVTEVSQAKNPSITGVSYTVERNDNLWDIAVRAYGDGYQWTKIAQANKLENPDIIHAGNVLTLPR